MAGLSKNAVKTPVKPKVIMVVSNNSSALILNLWVNPLITAKKTSG
ncbi:MAG: hypothetical protein RIT49_298 [Actinomycetota bacterium]